MKFHYDLGKPTEVTIPQDITHYVDLETDTMYKRVGNSWEIVIRHRGD